MRSLILLGLLALAPIARADAATVDGGMDRGGKMALAGGIVFSSVYMSTAIATPLLDSAGCGLGEHYVGCPKDRHDALLIPIVGGFVNAGARYDGSTALGLASSVVQLTGVGLMIAGLAIHRWHVPARTLSVDERAAQLQSGLR